MSVQADGRRVARAGLAARALTVRRTMAITGVPFCGTKRVMITSLSDFAWRILRRPAVVRWSVSVPWPAAAKVRRAEFGF